MCLRGIPFLPAPREDGRFFHRGRGGENSNFSFEEVDQIWTSLQANSLLSPQFPSEHFLKDGNRKINYWGVGLKPLLGSKWGQGRDRFVNECEHPTGNLQQLSLKYYCFFIVYHYCLC